ncbi:MAG: DUF2235 domain-containing protein [Paracoccus sp. (in: a-proteobacteria)]|nr:DUF2235 domain-containing protein [Paracoccus sp. (in: a-proteobacteria)]
MKDLAQVDAAASGAAAQSGIAGETGNLAQSCPKVTLEIGVFFDGTLNNRFNVMNPDKREGQDSYFNALSNPALLFDVYKNGPAHDERNSCGGVDRAFRSIYVQGPGSVQGEDDDNMGYALGQGQRSGVESRVLWGFRQVLRQIRQMGGVPALRKVVLDVFGFSRGAAAARYFVNCIRAGTVRYDPVGPGDFTENLPAGLTVEIRFLGIFDTVAAIGKADNDDNAPVNVHLKTAQVTGQIYHLTASDEYRRNFRLNRNTPGGGDSFALPGAHSDVGGGYLDNGDDAQLGKERRRSFPTRAEAEAEQAATRAADQTSAENRATERVFIREGWLNANETEGGVRHVLGPITQVRSRDWRGRDKISFAYDEQLMLHRPWVRAGLSRIALRMMHEAALGHVNGAFLDLPPTTNYTVPDGLQPYEAEIRAGTLTGANRRAVLRGWGHVSAKDGPYASAEWIGHRADTNRQRTTYPNQTSEAI